jgi:hypothetical protein
VVFLGSGASAESVSKFHVALHAALPILTSKFSPKVAPILTSKFHQILPSQGQYLKIPTKCNKTLLNFSPCSTSYRSTFSTFDCLTFSSTCLYQKGERALPGNLNSQIQIIYFPHIKCRISHNSPAASSVSLFVLKRGNGRDFIIPSSYFYPCCSKTLITNSWPPICFLMDEIISTVTHFKAFDFLTVRYKAALGPRLHFIVA